MTRTEHVWVASKDGEERRYTSAVPFTEHFRKVLDREGYVIRCVSYPVEDLSIHVAASAVDPSPGEETSAPT